MLTRRQRAWIIAGPLAIATPIVLLLNRSDEKVREFGLTQRVLGISHGEVYIESGNEIRVESIDGKRVRHLRVPPGRGSAPRQLVSLPNGRTLLQVDEAGGATPALGETPAPLMTNTPGQHSRLWDISAGLSDARELLRDLPNGRFRVAGTYCYWLKPSKQYSVVRMVGKRKWVRQVPESDLLVTSLDGGASRRIATGLSTYTQLDAVDHGVSWHGHLDNGGSPDTLYVVFPPEFRVTTLQNVPANVHAMGNRLLWFDSAFAPGTTTWRETTVMTCDRKGNDRRELTRLSSSAEWLSVDVIGKAGGVIWWIANKKLTNADGSYRGLTSYLARIDETGIAPVKPLPEGVSSRFLDGGYLYYAAPKRKENWFDWSADGLVSKLRWVIYRTPLPTGPT